MRKLVLGITLLMIAPFVFAQKTSFVYLQTDPQQPFFIKYNEKIISSSASGYLILPSLAQGTHAITVGFSGGKVKEQIFNLHVQNLDKGYLIKQLGEGEINLFDLQTTALIAAANKADNSTSVKLEKENVSAFTNALSKASADTTLLYTTPKQTTPVAQQPVVVKQEVVPAPPPVVEKKDTIVATVKEEVVAVVKEKVEPVKETVTVVTEPVKVVEPVKEVAAPPAVIDNSVVVKAETVAATTSIQRKAVTETAEGTTVVYEEAFEDGNKELITIIVPPSKQIFKETPTQPTEQPILKGNICKTVAGEKDFLALRRKMVAKTNDESMIAEAEKVFKTKCFTTTQVKNLGNMFLSNAGKYNFYAMAKNYISDINNFPSLSSELKDTFYINQFNKLIQ